MKKKLMTLAIVSAMLLSSAGQVFAADEASAPPEPPAQGQNGMSTPPEKPDGESPSGGEMAGERPSELGEKVSFSDVADDAWYAEYVKYLAMRGIMTGKDGAFNPDTVTTRAEYVNAIYKAAGSPDSAAENPFNDIADDAEYAKAVSWAYENGIAQGNGDGTFSPDDSLTREMAMTFLYRAFSVLKLTADEPEADVLGDFADSASVSEWARTPMEALVNMGIINGDNGNLKPQTALVNSEVAAMLYRALGGDNKDRLGGQPADGQTPPDMPGGSVPGGAPGGAPGGFGGSTEVTNGTAATTISEDSSITGETYTSTGDDENALRIDGANVTLSGITVNKTGGSTSNTENGDFYGQNAGLLALNGADVTITDSEFNTTQQNGNAVFSYGEGTTVTISNSTIRTSADNSGGIQTTGGGTTKAYDLDVETKGNSSAAIRSDRGGGTVVVDGGSYTTNGTGSPAVYSTADITVSNATLAANNSEGIVVEGKNKVTLNNCVLTGNMQETYKDGTENIHNVMLYQSMSGDADVGTSSFTAKDGSITAKSGDMFYVTNTSSVISLENVALTLANETLLTVEGNSSSRGWGTAGANGGQLTFNASNQKLEGAVTVDTISTLAFNLSNNSDFTGTINIVDNSAGGTAVDNNAVVTIDEGSTWTLTGDCAITSLTNNGTINFNGHTITLADGTVLK